MYSQHRLRPSAPALTSPLSGWLPQRASCRQPQSSRWTRRPRQTSFHPAFCRRTPPACTQLLPRRCSSQRPWLGPLSGKRRSGWPNVMTGIIVDYWYIWCHLPQILQRFRPLPPRFPSIQSQEPPGALGDYQWSPDAPSDPGNSAHCKVAI